MILRAALSRLLVLVAGLAQAAACGEDSSGDAGGRLPTTTPDAGGPDVSAPDGPGEPQLDGAEPLPDADSLDASLQPDARDSQPTSEDADAAVPGGPGQAPVVTCSGWPIPALRTGVCSSEDAAGAGLRLRGTVLAPNQVLRGGEVLLSAEGIVLCAACDCSSRPEAAAAARITCPQGVISPGLINTHDHLTFSGSGPVNHTGLRYAHRHDWRLGLRGHTPLDVPGSASTNQILAAELRGVLAGTTSTISGGGRRGLLRNLDVAAVGEGLFVDTVVSDTFPLDDGAGILQAAGCAYGGNPRTPASVSMLNAFVAHVAEGIDLEARNELRCVAPSELDLLAPQTALVHAIAAAAGEAKTLADERSWVIWSPRSNLDLYGNTAPVTLLDRSGVGIALGTDWLASGSMNLLRELDCADQLNQERYADHFSDFDLWRMVTTNAAFAAGVEAGIGLLAPGRIADVAIFDARTRSDHRAVIGAEAADVVLVLRGGRPLYGDETLLSSPALGAAACEPLTVCGTPKLVCAARDTGVALADLASAAGAVHPLFFCGAPDPEPSCVPQRPGEYDGARTASDADGDGVLDGADRCPQVFDPPRPMDTAGQADSDGDGRGDACDPCPLDPSDGCTRPSADDVDRDGISNGTDNCPNHVNTDQLDGDGDGHGNACDFCSAPNPGLAPCPLPIRAVRDPSHPEHPPLGARVILSGLMVSALRPAALPDSGFYVQHPSREPWSGIFVFTGARAQGPAVGPGNRVTVAGRYQEFFGLSELTDPRVTIEDTSAAPLEPIEVAPADIATGGTLAEAYESMLVRVLGVTVTTVNPDLPGDFDELAVTGNLRVDDRLFPDLDNTYPAGTAFTSITGILDFSFGNSKLLPRSAADLAQ